MEWLMTERVTNLTGPTALKTQEDRNITFQGLDTLEVLRQPIVTALNCAGKQLYSIILLQ